MRKTVMLLYKGDKYYQQFIGRYFKRITERECDYVSVKILGFHDRKFQVEYCYLTLGNGLIEFTEMSYSMVDADNFVESTEHDHKTIKYLIEEPKPVFPFNSMNCI